MPLFGSESDRERNNISNWGDVILPEKLVFE